MTTRTLPCPWQKGTWRNGGAACQMMKGERMMMDMEMVMMMRSGSSSCEPLQPEPEPVGSEAHQLAVAERIWLPHTHTLGPSLLRLLHIPLNSLHHFVGALVVPVINNLLAVKHIFLYTVYI